MCYLSEMSWPIGLGRRIAVTASVAVAAATAAMSTLPLAGAAGLHVQLRQGDHLG
jgi:hypothetical protein